jgi:hypothetical protein
MDLFKTEEIVAPTIQAAVAQAIAPVAPVKTGAECTRDTRGEADCAVAGCENCN